MRHLLLAVLLATATQATAAPPVLKGYGLMQGGSRNNPLSVAQFANPKIGFFVLRDRWNKQEVTNDHFNFTYNANQVRRARKAGKPYVVATMCGVGGIPTHATGGRAVAPWATTIPQELSKYIYAQANTTVDGIKIKDDPLLAAVWLPCLGEPSQEGHLNGIQNRVAGFTTAGMFGVITRCGDATIDAFNQDMRFIYSVSGQPDVQKYQKQALDHFKAKLGKDRLYIQHNSLGPQTTVTATHHQIVLDAKRQGYRVGAEMVQPGRTSGLGRFPERDYAVLYPGDETSSYVK